MQTMSNICLILDEIQGRLPYRLCERGCTESEWMPTARLRSRREDVLLAVDSRFRGNDVREHRCVQKPNALPYRLSWYVGSMRERSKTLPRVPGWHFAPTAVFRKFGLPENSCKRLQTDEETTIEGR